MFLENEDVAEKETCTQENDDDNDMTPDHYTCGVCSLIFSEKQALWDHMPFHSSTDKEGQGSDENND